MKYEDLLRTLDLEEFKEAFHGWSFCSGQKCDTSCFFFLEHIGMHVSCDCYFMWLPKLLDNNIDDESVLLLGDVELKELIPKIGPRLKFKKLLDELKLEAAQDVTLTNGCLDGRAVIIEGEASGGLLKEGSRRKLSLILINETIKNHPDYKISSEQFQKLASGIVATFPKESTVVYYSPYVAGKDNTAKKNSSGKLYERYITRRRKLRQSGELAGTSRRASSCSSGSTSVTSNFNFDSGDNSDNNEPNDYVENLTFLKNNVEPWGKVEEIWSATSSCRLKNLYRKNNSGIHLKYPALRQPQGYILVPYWLRCSKSMVRPTYVEVQHWYRTGSGVVKAWYDLLIKEVQHRYRTGSGVV
ncbi:hypothetical protein ACJJTC_010560 [Scirpophaga incertulas]